jgi:hypothetical protein
MITWSLFANSEFGMWNAELKMVLLTPPAFPTCDFPQINLQAKSSVRPGALSTC